jgi:IS5 family transposase
MAWKNLQQTTLVDAMFIDHQALTEMDDVHELIVWLRIESLLAVLQSNPRHFLMMFKTLLLQSWYTLSDPALEKQLARDLLVRRFIGLSIASQRMII